MERIYTGKRGRGPLNLAGQRFGRLIALEIDRTVDRRVFWRCQCDCGNQSFVVSGGLRSGGVRSCGCLRSDFARANAWRHGMDSTPESLTWQRIRQRCENPANPDYKNYGGRGIKVCERWQTLENFIADMGKRPPGLTIDRINNDGDYEPGNCRWATRKRQNRNRRDTIHLSINGKTAPLQDWCDQFGAEGKRVMERVRRGWEPLRALTTPPDTKHGRRRYAPSQPG